MHRFVSFFALTVLWMALPRTAPAQSITPPSVYELLIDGESFLVEANRTAKLQSKQRPGVSYEVALRIAPTQRLRLNSVQLEYDWLTKVEDDHKRPRRFVRMTHELGFTMMITDLGKPLPPKAQDEILDILTESLAGTYRDLKVGNLEVGQPRQRKFVGAAGRGVIIRYRDAQQLGHTCLVYVLGGPKFCVSCVIEYFDDDFEGVKGLLKKTLDSFQPVG